MFKNTFILILSLGLSFLFYSCSNNNLKSNFEELKTQIINSSNVKLSDSLRNQLLDDAYVKTKTIKKDFPDPWKCHINPFLTRPSFTRSTILLAPSYC